MVRSKYKVHIARPFNNIQISVGSTIHACDTHYDYYVDFNNQKVCRYTRDTTILLITKTDRTQKPTAATRNQVDTFCHFTLTRKTG